MKEDIQLKALVGNITNKLEISDRFLCLLIGIHPASLSTQRQNLFSESEKDKVERRLGQIYCVIHQFLELGLSKEVILECLRTPSFQDLKNNFDSVSSAIQQDKSEIGVLLEIGKSSHKKFLSKKNYAR